MNQRDTLNIVQRNKVAVLQVSSGQEFSWPDPISKLVIELGNKNDTLPFMVIIPSDLSRELITFNRSITLDDVTKALTDAGPSVEKVSFDK